MSTLEVRRSQFSTHFLSLFFCGTMLATCPCASEFEGFTEPFRALKVASDETGTVSEVLVREGDRVEAGQELVKLNSDIHQAFLAIALQNMQAEGRLRSSNADLHLKRTRLEKLLQIKSEGFARQEEIDRAQSELTVSEANVRTAEEDLLSKKLEHDRIQTQIRRRTIQAPIDGVITVLHKDQGEFVAPNSPEIVTLVQLDRLLANFTLTGSQVQTISLGEELPVTFSDSDETLGTVEYISPVMDAESGTVLVKLRIDNADRIYQSGQRCRVRLPD
ncbi:MAG: efflux RND transporter periplasmic adaptor subunit [Pirellulaceae bacterium]|nr:efflux RND transporter periplasmic adaptor subunit [Pirellulaceae bacterium]